MRKNTRPLPEVSERTRPFFDAALDGRLVLQLCSRCKAAFFPAVELCRSCLRADSLAWSDASGRGRVFSYVVMHQVYHPAFAAKVPYLVADIALREGPHMISRIEGTAPADVRIGMRVRVSFERMSEAIALPVFRVERD